MAPGRRCDVALPLGRTSCGSTVKPIRFKVEAKPMIWILLALIALALAAGLLRPWLMEQVAIDHCLDAGGAFDYQAKNCIGAG